ncbi:MAG: metallophosphoesterase [Parcubacteria group bacterium]|nr:metallophosphoesterase [Parcubacteria group bacterium]
MVKVEITQNLLIEMLDKFGSNRGVAAALEVDEKTIRNLRLKYGILKGEYVDKKIISTLRKQLGKGYPYRSSIKNSLSGEALISQLSDWHLGAKVVNSSGDIIYDQTIAKKRAEALCLKCIELFKNHISGGTKITQIHIPITGDMADGGLVYPGQAYRTEMSPPKQVMVTANIIRNYILGLAEFGLPVYIHAVPGNHGVPKVKDWDPTANWDLMLYMILADWIQREKLNNVFLTYVEGDYLLSEIMGWKYLFRHKGPSQAETASGAAKTGGWQKLHGCDAMVYGHWHHMGLNDWNSVKLFMSPSLKGPDEFTESIAKGPTPAQCIWGVTKKHLFTFYYTVSL